MKEFYIIESGKLVKYLRDGSCNQCGECCKRIIDYELVTFVCDDCKSLSDFEVSLPEGFSIFQAQGVWWILRTEVTEKTWTCPNFESGLCEIWDGWDFPVVCRYWPVHPRDLVNFPKCGFWFERIE